MLDRPEPPSPERLTRAAWRAWVDAARASAGPVDPAALFGALAALPTSVAARALRVCALDFRALGVPGAARSGEESDEAAPAGAAPGPEAAAFLALARAEAARLGHHPVGTGHLVLALLHPAAGPVAANAPIDRVRFEAALEDVLARPWLHGFALDGEHLLYLTRDEVLVLHGLLARRGATALAWHPAETVVLDGLRDLLAPCAGALLRDEGLERLDAARRRTVRLRHPG